MVATTQTALITAIVTASVAILVAVITQVSTWRLERRRQDYERRRLALVEMQDQALELRLLLSESGRVPSSVAVQQDGDRQTVSFSEDPDLVRARSQAEAALQVRISRLEDAAVRRSTHHWLEAARIALLGPDDDVTPADERATWDSMCELVRQALTSTKALDAAAK